MPLSIFRMNTSKSVSKQRALTPFRVNTYEKSRGVGSLWLTRNRTGTTAARPFKVRSLAPAGHDSPHCLGRVEEANHEPRTTACLLRFKFQLLTFNPRTPRGLRLLPGASRGYQLITDERELLPIRRPRRHVHRSLPSKQFRQHGDLLVFERHHAQHHILVLWMAFHAGVISQEHHLLPVRRNVRKPIIVSAKSYLPLLASIRAHPPDLHVPGAFGVEVNVFSIWRVFRAVVQSLGGR